MVINKLRRIFIVISVALLSLALNAQEKAKIVDFMSSEDYIVGGVTITGVRFLDANALIGISGLKVGEAVTIPGDAITTAEKKLWQQGLFSDVRISITKVQSDTVFLDINLLERPRISSVKLNGLK